MIFRSIQRAINYAEKHLTGPVDFRTAAGEAYMSVATFYRAFELLVGMSFMEYVRRRRLACALVMLKQQRRIADIACELEYNDFGSFSRAFRKEFGLSPSAYARGGMVLSGMAPVDLMPDLALAYGRKDVLTHRRTTMAEAQQKRVIDGVKRVGFLQDRTDELYAPESFAFPACFVSAMRAISGESHERKSHSHGRDWIYDLDYHEAMGASGMAFGNLWMKNHGVSMAVNDFTLIAPRAEIFTRTFAWFGYEMSYYTRKGTESEGEFFRELIVDSISQGRPVLASNLIETPEFSIITGYDEKGAALIGWSPFQNEPNSCDGFEPDGQFRLTGWYDRVWELVTFGERSAPQKDPYRLLEWGLCILEGRSFCDDGFVGGLAAYDAWIDFVGTDKLFSGDEGELRQILAMHSNYAGQLAESRAWGESFFHSILPPMLPKHADELVKAGEACLAVHDLMWEIWGALGAGPGDMSVWERLGDRAVRKRTAEVIAQARDRDRELIAIIKTILSDRLEGDSQRLSLAS